MRSRKTAISGFTYLFSLLGGGVLGMTLGFSQSTSTTIVAERVSNSAESYQLLQSGDKAYYAGDYKKAVEDFKKGLDLLSPGSQTQVLKEELADRYATAASQEANRLTKDGRLKEARALLEDALSDEVAPHNQAAQRALDYLEDPIRTNPALTPEHVQNVDQVRRHLYMGEGAYNLGKFDEAKEHYEKVLKIDPYNKAARRGMERVTQRQADYYVASYDSTRARLLSEIDAQWEFKKDAVLGEETSEIISSHNIDSAAAYSALSSKLETLIIPNVDFQGVDLYEAVDFLREQSRVLDSVPFGQGNQGVQFVINVSEESKALTTPINLTLSNVPLKKVLETVANTVGVNMKVDEFAVIFTGYGEDDALLISRTYNVAPDFLSSYGIKKEVSTDPFSLDDGEGSQALLGQRVSAQQVLENMGVTFENGATATFLPSSSTLIVKNTQEQLEVVSNLVQSLAREQPINIMLEVKLISIEQSNDEDLGVDWTIEGSIIDAIERGVGIYGGSVGNGKENEAITGRPVTAGNRTGDYARNLDSIDQAIQRQIGSNGRVFTSFDPFVLANTGSLDNALLGGVATDPGSLTLSSTSAPAPGVFSVSAALNQSTVQAMLRGLSQKKGTDFMTQPSVTTRSGQLAKVEIGREFMYATEYEPPEISDGQQTEDLENDINDLGQTTQPTWRITWEPTPLRISSALINGVTYTNYTVSVTPSHPTAFETVLIGTDLEIEPTYEKQTGVINLAIRNTYKDFDGYINYGSPINALSSGVKFTDEYIANNPDIQTPLTGTGFDGYFREGSDPFPPGVQSEVGVLEVTQSFVEATPNYILMPVFQTINTQTNVTVYDGATLILGGMIKSTRVKGEDETPILSKIPLIGSAFEANTTQTINKQVLIMVTAKVVDPTGRPITPQF